MVNSSKYLYLLIFILLISIKSFTNDNLKASSWDIGAVSYYPFHHYRELSKINIGGKMQYNFYIDGIDDLRIFYYMSASYNFIAANRFYYLIDCIDAVGVGWTFHSKSIDLTPSVAYGYMKQLAYGDFELEGRNGVNTFINQVFISSLELSINSWDKYSFVISPGLIAFTGEEVWGTQIGIEIGLRYKY